MANKTFQRQIWLLNTLIQHKRLTYKEIKEMWRNSAVSEGEPFAQRSFHACRRAIEEMFDVNIECDASDGYRYYIEDLESLKNDRSKRWLLNSFSVSNMIDEGRQMPERIMLDDVPGGTQYLSVVVDAMRLGRALEVSYLPLGHDEPQVYHLHPYCMREHRQRWYMLGWLVEREALRQLAFDRIVSAEMTSDTYTYPSDFNPEAYYANDYGITVNENKPVETIRLRVFGRQVGLFRLLPLHQSQREVETGSNYSIFEYHVRINSELKRELLSKANNIEVLEPEDLRKSMCREARSILKRYGLKK